MKQKLTLIIAMTFVLQSAFGQIIDRYGINIGASYATQIWDFKLVPVDFDNDYKVGLMTFIQVEKDFSNLLSLRTEFGYIQKGFKNNLTLTFSDGTQAGVNNDNVVLHNLALNIGLKITPFKFDYSPYLFMGCRNDYMISYKDIVIEEQASGLKFNMYESTIEDFNKYNLGGILGLGIDIKGLLYFEIEYNPNFTRNLDEKGLSIKDNCWGAKVGLNINILTE